VTQGEHPYLMNNHHEIEIHVLRYLRTTPDQQLYE
jgi:hypothetical protein